MPGSHGAELREIARLKGQLDALQQDIGDARKAACRGAHGGLDLHASADSAIPPARGEPVWLPDGHEIRIRQIDPGDAPQLKIGFDQLGALTRYRSFLDRIAQLAPSDLDYLTHVDHASHEQLVAQDAATGEAIGSAGYVCTPPEATSARVLIVVADQWQHRGVGAALAERLTARARAAGVERFDARTIVGHIAARRMLGRMGEIISERHTDGIADFVIRV
jgi:GNAT superfamily N-acetyltransferase